MREKVSELVKGIRIPDPDKIDHLRKFAIAFFVS